MNLTAQDEIAAYMAGVRQALAVLPEATRDELLEDLPEHLAEVLAEGGGSLVERLGPPHAYAAELSMTAGMAGALPGPPRRGARFAAMGDQASAAVRRADVRFGPLLGYAKASEFLVLLRPAWWVLRGYLAAMAFAHLFGDNGAPIGLLPRIGDNELVALLLLAAAVLGSIWLGRRGVPAKPLPRRLLQAGSAALVIFALAGFFETDDRVTNPGGFQAEYVSQLDSIQDVFVYDGQGRLVENAQLYDQYGTPIQLGDNSCYDDLTGSSERSASFGYPHCPDRAPFRDIAPAPIPREQPSGTPTEEPRIGPSFVEGGEPAPKPSVSASSPSANVSPSVSASSQADK